MNSTTDQPAVDSARDTVRFDYGAIDRALARKEEPLAPFRNALQQNDALLRQHFEDGADAAAIVHGRAAMIDQILVRAWRSFIPACDDIALIAVGGYGRGELLPGSDIDLMVLLAGDQHERFRESIERFLVFLWDIGLEVGHSVRSVDECLHEAERDITVATNMMEARLLAGPTSLFQDMRTACDRDRIWPSREFFEAKLREQHTRHRRFHDTAYNLEPNVKESPGGLRDIQMIGWVAKRHFGTDTLRGLVEHEFLTEAEYQALMNGQNFLWRIRTALHFITGRREDRLLFDHQRTLARQFGYRDENHRLAVEHFMKQYYRTVMDLNRLNEMLLQLFKEAILHAQDPGEPVAINKRFQARKGYLEVVDDDMFRRYPFSLMELFLLMAQHPELKGVRASTIRLVRAHRYLIDDDFRNDLRARSLFMEILRQPRGVTHELRRMNRYGVLAAYMPVFANIVGQMQYDLFHVYTVDEHTIFVVRNLRRFTVPEFRHEFPLCSEIIDSIPKPELLYLAGLFHDIAKGRGGDHSELGARDARAFCLHHGLSHHDANLVAWLVQHHLVMSTTAQRRDIADPLVINEFARLIGDRTRLNYLYLLTVADIRATNPELWNSWKDALLLELYTATKRALRRGLEHPLDQDEKIREMKSAARAELAGAGLERSEVDAVWQDFSEEYFLRHAPGEIAWHTRAIVRRGSDADPLVELRPDSARGGTSIFVYTRAQDHLFALTTALLDQLGLTVADARIITSANGYALDSYLVLEETGEPIQGEYRAHEILTTLTRELRDPSPRPARVTRHVPRQFRHFKIPTRVEFTTDEPNQRTIVELITADRPGLLSQVGRAFVECGVRLQNAKIATFGARAEDVFYVTDRADGPILDGQLLERLRETLVRNLEGQVKDQK